MPSVPLRSPEHNRTPILILSAAVVLLAAILLVYSQTLAFAWDEGFHLVTARLIDAGKRPYLDFMFPQTPLNAYWNAGWMRLFGQTWRVPHAVAAIMTALAMLLAGGFVLTRFPKPNWRLPAAITVVVLAGLSLQVFYFGTIAQAYGLGLFLIVAAFRSAVASLERGSLLLAAAAGLAASAAAASTLLTAAATPVLLVWIIVYTRSGRRLVSAALFLAAAVVPFLPVILLFAQGPRQVLFNVIEYNLRYRQVAWEGAPQHNLEVWTSWFGSSQALILGLLAIAGLRFVATRSTWDRRLRAEFYLCGWLALALGVHISTALPTFARYYLFLVPFLAMLASAGLYHVASRLYRADRAWRAVALVCVLFALGLGRDLHDSVGDLNWSDLEELAKVVNQVTPRNASLLADEQIYFLTKRQPPTGMELDDSHKFDFLPPARASLMHIVQRSELDKRIEAGEFATLETCGEDSHIRKLNLQQFYKHQQDQDDCTVFWDLKH